MIIVSLNLTLQLCFPLPEKTKKDKVGWYVDQNTQIVVTSQPMMLRGLKIELRRRLREETSHGIVYHAQLDENTAVQILHSVRIL